MKINGQNVPDARFEQEWQRLHQARRQDPQLQQMQEDELRRMTMENVIGQVILEQQAAKRYNKIPNNEVNRQYKQLTARYGSEKEFLKANRLKKDDVDRVKDDIRRRLQVEKLLDKIFVDVKEPDEKEVFDEYMKNPAAFGTPEQVHASHIVKHTNQGQDPVEAKAAADEVRAELAGGADFNEMAEKHSDCASGAQDLGTFPRGQMVQRFEDVVFNMQPGDVSDVFETEFGFHIATVHEKIPATVTPFEDVKDQLAQYILRQRRNEAVDAFVAKYREQAKIED